MDQKIDFYRQLFVYIWMPISITLSIIHVYTNFFETSCSYWQAEQVSHQHPVGVHRAGYPRRAGRRSDSGRPLHAHSGDAGQQQATRVCKYILLCMWYVCTGPNIYGLEFLFHTFILYICRYVWCFNVCIIYLCMYELFFDAYSHTYIHTYKHSIAKYATVLSIVGCTNDSSFFSFLQL